MKRHQKTGSGLVVAGSLLLGACSDAAFPGLAKQVTTKRNSGDANLTSEKIATVTAIELDSETFRITPLRVGLQAFMDSDTPMLTFVMPPKADYVEILRCQADTIIKGAFGTINDVNLGSATLADEIEAFQSNNFWKAAAEQTSQCVLIAQNISSKIYLDKTADSGSYRYLMRPCVNVSRLSEASSGTRKVCSRQVAFSEQLSDFQNRRVQEEKDAMSRVQSFQDKVDGIGREIFFLAKDLNNALAKCQKEESDREKRVKRKEALATIAVIGVTLGMELAMPASGIQAVQAGTKTWMQLWSETWENRDAIAGHGNQLAGVFKLLFSSAKDFPKSCTEAKEVATKSDVKVKELQANHRELAQALDDAEAAKKSLVVGE